MQDQLCAGLSCTLVLAHAVLTASPGLSCRGIESIAKMTALKFSALHDCNSITNNGITAIRALHNLETLSLRGCRKLTNNGMATIKVRVVPAGSLSVLAWLAVALQNPNCFCISHVLILVKHVPMRLNFLPNFACSWLMHAQTQTTCVLT